MAEGPCTDWLSGADVADCCSVETSDGSIFELAAVQAQEVLYELSGRRFAGTCERTVRPCQTSCTCNWQVLSRGHLVWPGAWDGWTRWSGWWCDDEPCGCWPLSRVDLAGYPVQAISEVKINGAVVNSATYRLDRSRWLTRLRDPAFPDQVLLWPACQMLDLPDTEPGTWSVKYTYGAEVPQSGVAAAAQLACELYKACQGEKCALPTGTTRVTRQGVTIEKLAFTTWAWDRGSRTRPPGWNTGLPFVDMFLNTYNRPGILRRPTVWAPSVTRRYAPPVGS